MSDVLELLPSVLGAAPASVADAVDLDGVNDYGSRNSDLIGNADGKTFTFSCWFYLDPSLQGNFASLLRMNNNDFAVIADCSNSSGPTLSFQSSGVVQYRGDFGSVSYNTMYHIVVSFNNNGSGVSSSYLNDTAYVFNKISQSDANLGFTGFPLSVGATVTGGQAIKGRLSHLFLDYTYRDLSIEANRRLFVEYKDGFLQPTTTQASLNPILLMPFDDPTDPFRNDGSGGAFSLNGTIARSGRGVNQYNPAASEFDGVNDYLSKSGALTSQGKQLTFSCIFKGFDGTFDANKRLFWLETSAGGFRGQIYVASSGRIIVDIKDVSGVDALFWQSHASPGPLIPNKYYVFSFSCDMSSPSSRSATFNGEVVAGTYTTYADTNLALDAGRQAIGARFNGNDSLPGALSDLYFNTTYIDLSTDNPFYDTETGKAKPLGENGELPTGSQPLVYLPLNASNPGLNRGSGGDFTVNT